MCRRWNARAKQMLNNYDMQWKIKDVCSALTLKTLSYNIMNISEMARTILALLFKNRSFLAKPSENFPEFWPSVLQKQLTIK
jgi:hypothetical protein